MATQKRNALGRGLDALLSMDDVKTEGSSSINEIELAKITVNPGKRRWLFRYKEFPVKENLWLLLMGKSLIVK